MPSLALKIGIVIVGLILYFFAISALLNIRRDKSEQRVLFDSIDYNWDGVLTTEEITYFRPCPQTNKTTLVTRLNTLGPRVNYDQFENDVSRNMIKYTIAPCAVNAHLLADPTQLSKRNANTAVNAFFRTYDLDENGIVSWNEYNLVNKYHGKTIPGASDTFAFIDTNDDWEITRQQFLTSNLRQLDPKFTAVDPTQQPDPYAGPQPPVQQTQGQPQQPRDPYARYEEPLRRPVDPYYEPVGSRPRAARPAAPRRPAYDPLDDPLYDPYEPPRPRRANTYASRRAAEREPIYSDYAL